MSSYRYQITEAEWEAMLLGDTRVNRKIISSDSTNPAFSIDLAGVTYDQMSSRIGFETEHVTRFNGSAMSTGSRTVSSMTDALDHDVWDWVTVAEGAEQAEVNGKYSFPGNNASLAGQNYPFPTVIRQNDLSYGTVDEPVWVNVHYGAWPQDGCYWAQGRASMDIFADMVMDQGDPNEGWAVKTFRLYDTKGEWSAPTFELSTVGIVEPLGYTRNEDGSFDVLFRALRDGAVTVTAKDSGGGEGSPHFVLEVTHDLKLAAKPKTLTLYKDQESNFLLTAVSAKGMNDFSELGSWALSAAESENNALYDVHSASGNDWYITSTSPGTRLLTAAFSYDYHDEGNGERVYTETLFLTEHTLGRLGLSDGASYNEAWRAKSGANGAEPNPAYSAADPAPALPQGAQFFLYETASDEALSDLIVDRITVDETVCALAARNAGDAFAIYQTDEYQLILEDVSASDAGFAYRAGTLSYIGSGTPPAQVDIVIEAHFVMGEAATNEPYTLRIRTGNISTFWVDFIGDENEPQKVSGSMRPLGIRENADSQLELTLPESRFTRTGYHFAGWKLVEGAAWTMADGVRTDVALASPGDMVFVEPSENKKVVFAATWEANAYTVVFDPNGGNDEGEHAMEPVHGQYDVTLDLPVKFFAPPEGYAFSSWNTEPDGSGTAYTDGQNVKNLTAEEDAVVTLYAQWAGRHTLTLQSSRFAAGSIVSWLIDVNGTASLTGYEPPVYGGWQLDGWYTDTAADRLKILEPDGSIVKSVAGYTTGDGLLLLTQDVTLYARWETSAFLPVDALGSNAATASAEQQSAYSGTYLIVSEAGAGERYMLADTDTTVTEKAALAAVPVTASSGTVEDEAGNIQSVYIADSGLDAGKWTLTYQAKSGAYPCYSFISANNRGLARGDANQIGKYAPAQAWASLTENRSDAWWSYGLKNPHGLDSYEWVSRTTTCDGIGWSKGDSDSYAFRRLRGNVSTEPLYLYVLQTVYTFD